MDNIIRNAIENFLRNINMSLIDDEFNFYEDIYEDINVNGEVIEEILDQDWREDYPKHTITVEQFRKLKTVKYSGIINCVITECPICFDKFEEDNKVVILQCKHYFHYNCIKKWLLEENNTCPICRKEVK